jgi:SAM-dependent methyltransferase
MEPLPHTDMDIVKGYADAIDEEYVSQMPYRIKTFEACMDRVEEITGLTEGRILDVGAAAGAFVKVAKDRGWVAHGVEPCGYLTRWAIEKLGLDSMHTGTLNDVELPGKYDVITLWDVLEHVPDPYNTVYLIKNLLKDGGYLITNVPDISAVVPRLMGRRWPFYASCHLYYYTPETLDFLMRRHGFERTHRSPHWQELSLGYLAYRFEQFSPAVSKIMVKIIGLMGLSGLPLKYNIGQTLFVYRKVI